MRGPLGLLFPEKCAFCGRILEGRETDLCESCRRIEPFSGPAKRLPYVERWTAAYYYEEPVRNGLLRYKFRGKRHAARPLGQMLAMAILRAGLQSADLITYVPVSAKRRRERGYDQDRLLAEEAARALGRRAVPLLKKVRHTPAQSGLSDAAQRHANVMGAYRATGADLAGKHILLIDDIVTTGATVSECARVLLTAGAADVSCACFAAHREKKERKGQSQ